MTELWLMFSAAFLAATLLPGGSEFLLIALVNENKSPWEALVIMATVGNTFRRDDQLLFRLFGAFCYFTRGNVDREV